MNTEIIEGNKMIAEFMQLEKCTDPLHADNPCYFFNDVYQDAANLQYHTSWDLLMPVVEKINFMDDYAYDVIIWRNDCHINDKTEIIFEGSRRVIGENLITVVWQTVVQFIEWYTTQLNKPKYYDNRKRTSI